ncbi:hypothetical protein RB620_03980 [Paenibacillus sp. LHD-117]|uniref:hypothetical protein n=1 Tax=Paenibacillus sp. LHD-117 TaxID=3071412 RepID=UPI0027E019CD|nr:hypothetical protein [Paenibacillus sp. LHD-117]MDQ6418590.1 hypothetical protein [Paenibacillus sp. LHD-117]
MHQSRKEQGLERTTRQLMLPDLREARIMAELEADIAATEQWGGRSQTIRRPGFGL